MVEFTTTELQWAFNWACAETSKARSSFCYEQAKAKADRIHDELCKLDKGLPTEFSCSELSDIASVALDVKIKSQKGTPRFELARSIFQKAVDIRKALEGKTA